jgi:pectinesterase
VLIDDADFVSGFFDACDGRSEKVEVPLNKSFILLEGEGRVQTIIEWGDHANAGGNSTTTTSTSPTFTSYATDFMARDISFKVSRP